jgi:hypothetical protein
VLKKLFNSSCSGLAPEKTKHFLGSGLLQISFSLICYLKTLHIFHFLLFFSVAVGECGWGGVGG